MERSIINLGTIPLELGHAPRSYNFGHKWNNPIQRTLTGKPLKQRSGTDLDTINIVVFLRKEFLVESGIEDSPYAIKEKLKALGDNADVIAVSTGNGTKIGDYTLDTLNGSVTDMADDGGWLEVELTIDMSEFVAPSE